MKRIKLSEPEVLAVVVNLQRELAIAFEMLGDKSKESGRLKRQIIADLQQLLTREYRIDLAENNLYDSIFKPEKAVSSH